MAGPQRWGGQAFRCLWGTRSSEPCPPRPVFLAQQRFRRECVQGWQTYSPGDERSDSRSGCVALGQPLDLSEPWSSCCKWGLCHLICVDFVKFLPERGFGGRAPLLQVLRKGGQAGELSWAGLKVGAEQRWGLSSPWLMDVL